MTVKLVGTTNQGTNNLPNYYGAVGKFTVTAAGLLSEIRIYSLASGYAKVAVYADIAGAPGNRLAKQDTSTPVTANQWNIIALESSISVTVDEVLWLAAAGNASNVYTILLSGGIMNRFSITYSTWTWPSTLLQPFDLTPDQLSIAGWGTIVVAGGQRGQIIG